MNIKAIINSVKVEQYGHDVGDVVVGVYGHNTNQVAMVIVEKKKGIIDGHFSYLVTGQDNPNYIAHALSYKDGMVLIDNGRIVGLDDERMGAASVEEARAQVWF